jgi:O-antigen ligase
MATIATTLQKSAIRGGRLEAAAAAALVGFVAASQLSIAVAQILLAVAFGGWAAVLRVHHERIQVPAMFWWLAAYSVATLFSALNSADPLASFADCKQLVLFLIVPIVYRFAAGPRAVAFTTIIVSIGALSALIGIAQFGLLHYDTLSHRPHGSLTHYMTYSGVLMLVVCATIARLAFRDQDSHRFAASRMWTVLVMPALVVALAVTFTRSAWMGMIAGLGTILATKCALVVRPLDARRRKTSLIAAAGAATVAVAFGFTLIAVVAPANIRSRLFSIVDLHDPSNRDRAAMLKSGAEIVRDHPLTGVGPDRVKAVYAEYRQTWAVNKLNAHLHNVPMQIAAERGLPALAIWIGFVVTLLRDLVRRIATSRYPSLAMGAIAAAGAMVVAGLFEYNFGDSEFLMLFLVLATLPYAADRSTEAVR